MTQEFTTPNPLFRNVRHACRFIHWLYEKRDELERCGISGSFTWHIAKQILNLNNQSGMVNNSLQWEHVWGDDIKNSARRYRRKYPEEYITWLVADKLLGEEE